MDSVKKFDYFRSMKWSADSVFEIRFCVRALHNRVGNILWKIVQGFNIQWFFRFWLIIVFGLECLNPRKQPQHISQSNEAQKKETSHGVQGFLYSFFSLTSKVEDMKIWKSLLSQRIFFVKLISWSYRKSVEIFWWFSFFFLLWFSKWLRDFLGFVTKNISEDDKLTSLV